MAWNNYASTSWKISNQPSTASDDNDDVSSTRSSITFWLISFAAVFTLTRSRFTRSCVSGVCVYCIYAHRIPVTAFVLLHVAKAAGTRDGPKTAQIWLPLLPKCLQKKHQSHLFRLQLSICHLFSAPLIVFPLGLFAKKWRTMFGDLRLTSLTSPIGQVFVYDIHVPWPHLQENHTLQLSKAFQFYLIKFYGKI